MRRYLSSFLIIAILTNFLLLGFAGSFRVEAGFWDDNKDGVFTVIKGLVMLWILNLIREKATGDDTGDFLTSTITNGLKRFTGSDEEEPKKTQVEISTDGNTTNEANSNGFQNQITTDREQKLVELVNTRRQEQGLRKLEIDTGLVETARLKARDMITNKYFDHISPQYGSPFNMLQERNIEYSLAGENLAEAGTVVAGFDKLMNSPEHRDNILEARYDKIGVGVIDGGSYGLVIVQMFIDSPEFDDSK